MGSPFPPGPHIRHVYGSKPRAPASPKRLGSVFLTFLPAALRIRLGPWHILHKYLLDGCTKYFQEKGGCEAPEGPELEATPGTTKTPLQTSPLPPLPRSVPSFPLPVPCFLCWLVSIARRLPRSVTSGFQIPPSRNLALSLTAFSCAFQPLQSTSEGSLASPTERAHESSLHTPRSPPGRQPSSPPRQRLQRVSEHIPCSCLHLTLSSYPFHSGCLLCRSTDILVTSGDVLIVLTLVLRDPSFTSEAVGPSHHEHIRSQPHPWLPHLGLCHGLIPSLRVVAFLKARSQGPRVVHSVLSHWASHSHWVI